MDNNSANVPSANLASGGGGGEVRRKISASMELTLSEATLDSPMFRASLQRNEDQLEELSWILENIVRNSRSCLEYAAKLGEALGKLSPSIRKMTELEIFDANRSPTCLVTMMEFVEVTFILHERLIRDLGLRLLIPMVQSVQDDLRSIREQRRAQEKSREKYENLSSKFSSIPKLREYPLIREDAFQLYRGRSQYFEQMFTYVCRISKFVKGADLFFVDKCLSTIGEVREFFRTMDVMISAMNGPADQMRRDLNVWQREVKNIIARLDAGNVDALESVKTLYSPDVSRPMVSHEVVERAGYLYYKRRQRYSWKKVYVALRGGIFLQQEMGKERGRVEVCFEFNVLLCEVRPSVEVDQRRNCFDVQTSFKTFCYQAETDEEMRQWIRVFENAKSHALAMNSGGVVADNNTHKGLMGDGGSEISLEAAPKTTNVMKEYLPFNEGEETLFTAFACLWQSTTNANTVSEEHFGKLYGTEKGIHFGSNIFGVQKEISLPFKSVKDINFGMSGFTGSLCIKLKEGGMGVKARTFLDEKINVDILLVLWRNSRLDKPKSALELKRNISSSDYGNVESTITSQDEIPCGCTDHLDRTEMNIIIPIKVDEAFNLLFNANSPVFAKIQVTRQYKNVKMEEWSGEGKRTVHFIIPLNHPLVKQTETDCIEDHFILKKDLKQVYVVRQEARTPSVIYGDTFVTLSQFCLTYHSEGRTRLKAHIGIRWIKSPLVKAMIRNTTMKGLQEYIRQYREAVWEAIREAHPEISMEHLEEDVEVAEVETRADKEDGGGGFGMVMDLVRDLRMRWRDNVRNFGYDPDILRKRFLIALVTLPIIYFYMSLAFTWFASNNTKSSNGKVEWPSYKQDQGITNSRFKFHSSKMESIFQNLHSSYSKQHLLKLSIHELLTHIQESECRLYKAQYIVWLADQLMACQHPTSDSDGCDKLQVAWTELMVVKDEKICK